MSRGTLIDKEAFFGMHEIDSNQIVCVQRRPVDRPEDVSEQRVIRPHRIGLLPLSVFSYESSRVVNGTLYLTSKFLKG
jgi:hypothetical protein